MASRSHPDIRPESEIARSIVLLRGRRVLLDRDLAAIYGASTGRLNEAMRRNSRRFPEDFMFQLSADEQEGLRSQIAISNGKRGGRRYAPHVFTEHGAIQAANVINTARAVEMGVYVVRAFVQLREWLSSNRELAKRFEQLEARLEKRLATHDGDIAAMLAAIRQLMGAPEKRRRGIGFTADIDPRK